MLANQQGSIKVDGQRLELHEVPFRSRCGAF
jgi:hypothetical protein